MNSNQLNKRIYKVRKPTMQFICALCGTQRQMRYTKNLSNSNYIQIIISSSFLVWLFWDFMSYKALSLFFVIWTTFEVVKKALYRKEIPCPHCGFDATWYRRDVKVAKNKIDNFWKSNRTETTLESLEKEQQVKGS